MSDLKKIDLKKLFNIKSLKAPKNYLKGYKLNLNFAISITFFLIKGKNLRNQYYYKGSCYYHALTALGVTYSRSEGKYAITHGLGTTGEVGFSGGRFSFGIRLYGVCAGAAVYTLLGNSPNRDDLYNYGRNKVNNITF